MSAHCATQRHDDPKLGQPGHRGPVRATGHVERPAQHLHRVDARVGEPRRLRRQRRAALRALPGQHRSGPPGRGKTHLAVAIAYRAIQNGFDACCTTAAHLIDHLSQASRNGQLREVTAEYVQPHVLVIDEVGYLHHADNAANLLWGVIDQRCLKRRPLIFTTNKPLREWGTVLHDPQLAEALLDRILERGQHIVLAGRSWRTRHIEPETPRPTPAA